MLAKSNAQAIGIQALEWLNGVGELSSVSPEVALQRPLAELVSAYLTASAESEKSARAYQTAVGLFLEYLGERLSTHLPMDWRPLARAGKDGRKTVWEFRGLAGVLRTVYAGVLDDFTSWRAAKGDSRKTLALRRSAVRTFLEIAFRDGVLTQEQAVNMGLKAYRRRQRRDEKPVGRRLKPDEVRKLRATIQLQARSDRKVKRDLALIDLMLFAGLRVEEVSKLELQDFRQDGGRWWIVLEGKGKKTRRIKLHDTLFKSLLAWLDALDPDIAFGQGSGALFYNLNKGGKTTGRALNSSVLGRLVAEYGAAAGLAPQLGENRLSPHDLRRTCARNAYDNGANLLLVQALLGHADPKTTTQYIGAYEQDDDTAVDYVRY